LVEWELSSSRTAFCQLDDCGDDKASSRDCGSMGGANEGIYDNGGGVVETGGDVDVASLAPASASLALSDRSHCRPLFLGLGGFGRGAGGGRI